MVTFWPSFTGALDAADTGAAVNTNTSAATAATSGIVLVDLMKTSFSRRSTDRRAGGIASTPRGYCGVGNLPIAGTRRSSCGQFRTTRWWRGSLPAIRMRRRRSSGASNVASSVWPARSSPTTAPPRTSRRRRSSGVASRGGLRPATRQRGGLAPHDHPQPRDRRRPGAAAGGLRPAGADGLRPRVDGARARTRWRSSATTPPGSVPRSPVSPRSSRGRSCSPACSATPRAKWARSKDIPLGTAKTRIRAALQRLRVALVTEERAE